MNLGLFSNRGNVIEKGAILAPFFCLVNCHLGLEIEQSLCFREM